MAARQDLTIDDMGNIHFSQTPAYEVGGDVAVLEVGPWKARRRLRAQRREARGRDRHFRLGPRNQWRRHRPGREGLVSPGDDRQHRCRVRVCVGPVLESVAYPFPCPDCGLEARVYRQGGEWRLSPDSCLHAVDIERRDGRVFVLFVMGDAE